MLQSQVNFLSLVTAATAVGTILSLSSAPALADSFDFNYSGAGVAASGTLTTNPFDQSIVDPNTGQQTGGYLITGITGQRNGVNINGLLPVSSTGGNDNLLIAASTQYLDRFGLAYQIGGVDYYNVFSISPGVGGYFEQLSSTSSATAVAFSITPSPATPVPEPSEEMVVLGVGVWIGSSVWGLRKKKLVSSQQS